MFLPKFYVRKMGPQIAKRLVLQIGTNLRKVRSSKKLVKVRKFADLQVTKLICGPPTFEN